MRVLLFVMVFVLFGCNDDVPYPIDQAPISAQSGLIPVQGGQSTIIDLSPWVRHGGNVSLVEVLSVKQLGSGSCSEPSLSNDGLIFTSDIQGPVMCEYIYEVEALAAPGQTPSRDKANVLVLTSQGGGHAQLPPIPLALALGDGDEVVHIPGALKENYPEGYSLHEDTTVLGSGIAIADSETATITYSVGHEGLTRVVYLLESPDGGDVKLGTLDIVVSDTLNHVPVAENFIFSDSVETNVEVTIDVADYVSDPDNGEIQLIGVDSITATVTSADPQNTNNT
ncbi:hypothetical protein F9L16_17715 [Agarivorans sp. B2Z047]|uniref:hypothetical protein n=1 Tax=Agarivorans sp. B2Z047 TaxID=2652721 RepID=UPI00128DEF79|nr:hypothetical protein [Agarivorans sp. B2Z047]MPW30826.1 hypothetical protein [Agarivorans sp. B2Z047]UQN40943.1 hypothetical protein LQZ07_14290 [Agarivorans sp. B2Z047]